MEGEMNEVSLCLVSFVLIVYVVCVDVIERRKMKYIHESSLAILTGFILAYLSSSSPPIRFNQKLFFNLFLPLVIFSAGYKLGKKEFFKHLPLITYLGLIASLLMVLVLAALVSLLADFSNVPLSFMDVLLMACVLSSNDTVAALGLIKEKTYPKLNSVLFGEGIVNDAVVIVLFRTVEKSAMVMEVGQVLQMGGFFIYLLAASVGLGVAVGLAVSLLLKKRGMSDSPIGETALVFLVGFFSYLCSEYLHLSGIMSLFTCSMVMSHYTFQNISPLSQQTTLLSLDVLSTLSEAFLYLYLGVEIYNTSFTLQQVTFSFLLILALAIARFFAVFLLPFICYVFRIKAQMSLVECKVIWYSGLIRGSISFALALNINSENRQTILSTTLLLILITTFIMSSLLQPFTQWIALQPQYQLPHQQNNHLFHQSNSFHNQKQSNIIHNLQKSEQFNGNFFKYTWNKFDKNYMQPLFTKKTQNEEINISLTENK